MAVMKPRSDSILKLVLVVGAVLLIPPAGYITAYYARTVAWGKVPDRDTKCRVYPTAAECLIFMPAALIESKATGRDITTAWQMR